MKTILRIMILILPFFGAVWADEGTKVLSGKFSLEAGTHQAANGQFEVYQYSRLLVQGKDDLASNLAWELTGEGDWQTTPLGLSPVWPLYPIRNVLDLEANNYPTSNGTDLAAARLDRALLKWTEGPLEVTGGLQSFDWG